MTPAIFYGNRTYCCSSYSNTGPRSILEKYFEDIRLVGFIHLVFTRTPGGVNRRRFRSLLLCPLSVERYYFPLFVDSLFEKQVFLLKTLGDWILNIRVRLGIVQQDSRR